MYFKSVGLLAISLLLVFLLVDGADAKGRHVKGSKHYKNTSRVVKTTTTTKVETRAPAPRPSPTPNGQNVCHSYTDHFKSKKRIVSDTKYNGNPRSADWVDISGDSRTLKLSPAGLEMRVLSPGKVIRSGHHNNKVGQGATLNSTYLLNYGAIEAKIKMSPVPGIVTAFITMSDRGDEIDWEWVGGSNKQVQSNYYYSGIPDYSKGKMHPISPPGNPGGPPIDNSKNWSIFRFEHHPDYLRFFVNGNIVRTVFKNQTGEGHPSVYHYPSEKARVQIGIWDSSTDDGTAQWANGPVNWNSLGPYVSAYVEYIKIECDPLHNKVLTY